MALAAVAKFVDITRRRRKVGLGITPSGNYTKGGDVLDLTKVTNPNFLQSAGIGAVPDAYTAENAPAGYTAEFIPGATLQTCKVKYNSAAGAEIPSQLAAPAAPVVTPTGVAGATNYSYTLTAVDSLGNETNAGAAGNTATGNAALSGANYNPVACPNVPGATSLNVYRTVGGATQGKIGNVANGGTLNDTGLAAAGVAPVANNTQQAPYPAALAADTTHISVSGKLGSF